MNCPITMNKLSPVVSLISRTECAVSSSRFCARAKVNAVDGGASSPPDGGGEVVKLSDNESR